MSYERCYVGIHILQHAGFLASCLEVATSCKLPVKSHGLFSFLLIGCCFAGVILMSSWVAPLPASLLPFPGGHV